MRVLREAGRPLTAYEVADALKDGGASDRRMMNAVRHSIEALVRWGMVEWTDGDGPRRYAPSEARWPPNARPSSR